MKSSHVTVLNDFFYTLREFQKEGKVFTTFRTRDNAIAGIELKGFKNYLDATDFVKSQFASDETPTVIERIDNIIHDLRQGKFKDREDIACLEPYLKKDTPIKKQMGKDPLLVKNRNDDQQRKGNGKRLG